MNSTSPDVGRSVRSFFFAICVALAAPVFAQDVGAVADPFAASEGTDTKTEGIPTHPNGDTPHDRMLSLAHTDALPRFDRIELYAVSMPRHFSDEQPKREPSDQTFPVRPYGVFADIHAQKTITGGDCDKVRKAWQSLRFDRLGGAFCHYPAYGLRLYRDDVLLFETTICWECQNFYVPRYDAEKRRHTHGWYGFAKDDNSNALLELFQSLLPHPKL